MKSLLRVRMSISFSVVNPLNTETAKAFGDVTEVLLLVNLVKRGCMIKN